MSTLVEMSAVRTVLQCPSSIAPSQTPSLCSSIRVSVKVSVFRCSGASPVTVVNGNVDKKPYERNGVRLGLPSKGRMATDTLDLLKDCQLSVKQVNPRQYVAEIPQWKIQPGVLALGCPYVASPLLDLNHCRCSRMNADSGYLTNLEVWFQRPKDVVRKLVSGDLDLGIVGLDTLNEYGQGDEDLILVHEALDYGDCRLSLAIPKYGIFENINSLEELAQMSQWTPERPLRVATGFTYLGPKFMKENGLKHVTFSTADGALEAAPAMGIADAIVDLVSSGTTLRENNLKEIEGGVILESQAVLVASRRSLIQRKGVLDITHEMLERFEAHLRAAGQFTLTANMRGSSADEVAERVLSQTSLSGLQGPTVSPVFCRRDGKVAADYYAIVICVPKKELYKSVQQLRSIGGSGVLVSPLTYIFDEETPRWRQLLSNLGL
ncbi:ATP phosphoribosyltransferase 2, chloroplastic [Castilleja foliolosa]|uniref:ATP phosphoribosyltransferase n=1 Tax=Castilleja foliolosa TaxID=1961234 RepID=A0ABD3CAA0_9LAMI